MRRRESGGKGGQQGGTRGEGKGWDGMKGDRGGGGRGVEPVHARWVIGGDEDRVDEGGPGLNHRHYDVVLPILFCQT